MGGGAVPHLWSIPVCVHSLYVEEQWLHFTTWRVKVLRLGWDAHVSSYALPHLKSNSSLHSHFQCQQQLVPDLEWEALRCWMEGCIKEMSLHRELLHRVPPVLRDGAWAAHAAVFRLQPPRALQMWRCLRWAKDNRFMSTNCMRSFRSIPTLWMHRLKNQYMTVNGLIWLPSL